MVIKKENYKVFLSIINKSLFKKNDLNENESLLHNPLK